MNNKLPVRALICSIAALLLSNCTNISSTPPTPNPNQTKPLKAIFVNPYQPGTYEHFKAMPSYPKTYKIYKNEEVLARTNPSNSRVVVDLGLQRAFLMNGQEVAVDYPVSTGNKKFPTPANDYKILEKIAANKRSNLYGKIYDADGKLVKSNANARTDTVPEGGKFQGALMSNWMRLSNGGIGMHRGRVPRYPASHGCIRTPASIVKTIYDKVQVGTPVTIRP